MSRDKRRYHERLSDLQYRNLTLDDVTQAGNLTTRGAYFDGDLEKKKSGSEYFGLGSVSVSHNDDCMAYSLDLKGSEYYTIYIRDIESNKLITEKIEETSGSITFSLDDKFIYYSKLDKYHRPRKIFRHRLGTSCLLYTSDAADE